MRILRRRWRTGSSIAYPGYTVIVSQTTLAYVGLDSPPPLADRVLADRQLADLAANPAFRP